MKIISVFGYSSSGKTFFIENAIKFIKKNHEVNVCVIKNIHEHEIDTVGKDSYKYKEAGAHYSILKNKTNKFTIFVNKELNLESMIKWLQNGPFPIDLIFLEGFRNTNFPSVLCTSSIEDIKQQLNDYVIVISGLVCKNSCEREMIFDVPIIDIQKDFPKFSEYFELKF